MVCLLFLSAARIRRKASLYFRIQTIKQNGKEVKAGEQLPFLILFGFPRNLQMAILSDLISMWTIAFSVGPFLEHSEPHLRMLRPPHGVGRSTYWESLHVTGWSIEAPSGTSI